MINTCRPRPRALELAKRDIGQGLGCRFSSLLKAALAAPEPHIYLMLRHEILIIILVQHKTLRWSDGLSSMMWLRAVAMALRIFELGHDSFSQVHHVRTLLKRFIWSC